MDDGEDKGGHGIGDRRDLLSVLTRDPTQRPLRNVFTEEDRNRVYFSDGNGMVKTFIP